jgi:hypothetical protein
VSDDMTLNLKDLVDKTFDNYYSNSSQYSLPSSNDNYFSIVENLVFATSENDIELHLAHLLDYCLAAHDTPSDVFSYYWDSLLSGLDASSEKDRMCIENYLQCYNFELVRALLSSGEFTNFSSFIDVLLFIEDINKLIIMHQYTFQVIDVDFYHRYYLERQIPSFMISAFTIMLMNYYPEQLLERLSSPSQWLNRHLDQVIDKCLTSPTEFIELLERFPHHGRAARKTVSQAICGMKDLTDCIGSLRGNNLEFVLKTLSL